MDHYFRTEELNLQQDFASQAHAPMPRRRIKCPISPRSRPGTRNQQFQGQDERKSRRKQPWHQQQFVQANRTPAARRITSQISFNNLTCRARGRESCKSLQGRTPDDSEELLVGGKLSSEICYSSFGYPQGANKHLAKGIHPAGLPERLFGWRVLTSIAKACPYLEDSFCCGVAWCLFR